MRGRWSAPLVLLAFATALAGCSGPDGGRQAAQEVASSFVRAVAGGDLAAACGLLARSTVEQLEQGGSDCPSAVEQAGLDDPGQATGTQVWGRAALVTFSGADVFLADVDGRWRVTAAGCVLRQESPAECDVEAG